MRASAASCFATSYRAAMFAEASATARRSASSSDYMTEETPLGTGGAIRNAARALTCGPDEPVLVLNGDILSGHDIARPGRRCTSKADAAVTLHLTEVDDPSRFGCVPTDDERAGDGLPGEDARTR